MRIIQISDSHISLDTPQRLNDLQRCVAAVNEQAPDLVIHTGDVAHDAKPEEYQQARDALDQLQAPWFVMPGNRDVRSQLIDSFSDRLQTRDGYIQYTLDNYPVRLLLIDTVSTDSNKGALCEKRMQHIEQVFDDTGSKPLLVFMHHTPFEVTEIPDPFQFEDWSLVERLLNVFNQSTALQAVYCGHVHRNVVATVNGLPVSAITCMACDLRKGQISEHERQRPMYKIIDV
jgi:3',5'-cyclic AMP phosphodiesterase CpdA